MNSIHVIKLVSKNVTSIANFLQVLFGWLIGFFRYVLFVHVCFCVFISLTHKRTNKKIKHATGFMHRPISRSFCNFFSEVTKKKLSKRELILFYMMWLIVFWFLQFLCVRARLPVHSSKWRRAQCGSRWLVVLWYFKMLI